MISMEKKEFHHVQNLLTLSEAFLYRIPHLKSAGGHRAEDWDLANPLQTCTLNMERVDNACVIDFFVENINDDGVGSSAKLFAKSIIVVSETKKLEYFLENVTDSSRYFVVKIEDTKTRRTAHIGVGFRERDDAIDFRMALQDYERSMKREIKAEAMIIEFQKKDENKSDTTKRPVSINSDAIQMSRLTLKEGEKMYLNLPGSDKERRKVEKSSGCSGTSSLLRKPPPPATGTNSSCAGKALHTVSSKDKEREEVKYIPKVSHLSAAKVQVNNEEVEAEEEDEWGDFESSA